MVIVRERTEKVGQEYIAPLLVLSGQEYADTPFQVLHDRIRDALRGNRPAVVAEIIDGTGAKVLFEDGTFEERQTDPDGEINKYDNQQPDDLSLPPERR